MKVETKSTAILVATLAVGVVLGMLAQGVLMQDRSRRVQALRKPPGFVREMEDAIQPRDGQLDTVRKILKAAATRNEAIYEADRKRLGLALDTMRLQLAPLLDKDQLERLTRVSQLPDPNRPPRQDDRPRRGDNGQPPRDDNRPPRNDDRQPPRDDNRPPRADDRQPPRNDNQPPPNDRRRPPGDEARRPDNDRPPANQPPAKRPPETQGEAGAVPTFLPST